MRYLVILDIADTVFEALTLMEVSRVLVVQDPREDLAELATVQFCRLPITLNEASLRGDELLDKLIASR